jgi:hypothetical protein
MEAQRSPEGYEEVDAVPVLAEDAGELAPRPSAAAGVVVAKQAAAVAATSFAAGVATVAVVRGARAVRARRRSRSRQQLAPVLATRSFLIDVHLLGSRD